MAIEKWYKEGLRFSCTQCGNCCTGLPGDVWTTADERRRIAEFLGLDVDSFVERYTHRVGIKYSLNEKDESENFDCVFLEHGNGRRFCSIYPVRPLQCRTWPFWYENLRTRSAWEAAAQGCPGMNHGEHYDYVQIEIQRRRRS